MSFEYCNAEQLQAVMHFQGPMLLSAGPGSGKTFTMIERIRYLIEQYGVEPNRILVITFTKAAANEMQNRFMKAVKEKAYPVHFGTFHAVFFHILKQTYHYQSENIISEKEKREYINYALEESHVKEADEALKEQLLQEFGKVKNSDKGIAGYRYTGALRPEQFRQVYENYRRICVENRKMDFDDMALQCLSLFRKREDVLKKWQEFFSYVLLDEFQDINAAQYAVIKLLVKEHHNLFVVGDDDQSIYGFRGASPAIMQKFLQDYPEAKHGMLSFNYRSGKRIIEASMQVISGNKNRIQKEIRPGTKETGSVSFLRFSKKEEETEALLKELRIYKNKKNLKCCALIFRTNKEAERMKKDLKNAGIPFWGEEKKSSFVSHFVTRDMESYIRFARGEQSREHFLRIMNKPSRFISRESLGEGEIALEKVLCYYADNKEKQKEIKRFMEHLKRLKNLPPFLAVDYIRREIQYDLYVRQYDKEKGKEQADVWKQALDWIQNDAANYRDMDKWLDSLKERREEEERTRKERAKTEGKTERAGEDKVTLLTMHGAKGLEFETVFLPGINEGTVPYGKVLSKEEEEEERRIFYVAMTRAKRSLNISCTENEKEQPSHFLSGLL